MPLAQMKNFKNDELRVMDYELLVVNITHFFPENSKSREEILPSRLTIHERSSGGDTEG